MTSILEIYRPVIEFTRVPVLVTPTINAGVELDVAAEAARPIKQRAKIETSVSYTATMRWERQLIEIDTPPVTSTPAVSRNLVWNGRNLVWSSKQLVWT